MCLSALVVASVAVSGCGGDKGLPVEPPLAVEDSAPAWSPDGQLVAYVHFNPDLADTAAPSGLYVIPATGGTPKLVVMGNPRSVDWAPDNRWLVYNDDFGLNLITVNGDSLTNIYAGGSFPSWSPDGGEIRLSDGHVQAEAARIQGQKGTVEGTPHLR